MSRISETAVAAPPALSPAEHWVRTEGVERSRAEVVEYLVDTLGIENGDVSALLEAWEEACDPEPEVMIAQPTRAAVTALRGPEPESEPEPAVERPSTPTATSPAWGGSALEWKRLSEIDARPIEFLDKPIWQDAAFHLVVGRKNSGKGTLLAGEAARVTRGELGPRRNVIWVATGEDSYAIDVRPRIEVADGDVDRVEILNRGRLILPDHVDELLRKAHEIGDVGMIVLDPLGGNLGGGKSSNLDSDVRPALSALNDLADRLGSLVAGVRHLTNKEIRGGVLAGVLGSSDWVNVPRVVLALVHDNEEDDMRHLTVVTGNRVKGGTGRLYRIEGAPSPAGGEEVTRAVHTGESTKNTDDLLDPEAGRPNSKTSRAREILLEALEQAPDRQIESDTLDALVAEQTGLAARSVRNLRAKLKNDGLVRAVPEKDEHGTVTRWLVIRTGAPR